MTTIYIHRFSFGYIFQLSAYAYTSPQDLSPEAVQSFHMDMEPSGNTATTRNMMRVHTRADDMRNFRRNLAMVERAPFMILVISTRGIAGGTIEVDRTERFDVYSTVYRSTRFRNGLFLVSTNVSGITDISWYVEPDYLEAWLWELGLPPLAWGN